LKVIHGPVTYQKKKKKGKKKKKEKKEEVIHGPVE